MSQKHVLIVTYYWPPAGGPGVQRWLKFTKYLPQNGISPIVYCPENPNYPIEDPSLEDSISDQVEVIKQRISEPYKIASLLSSSKTKTISSGLIPKTKDQSIIDRLLLFIRGNLFIPDARKNWVNPSVKYLSKVIQSRKIQCIITTGPPQSLHLIGLKIKEQLGTCWIADFRDPWTTIGYQKSLKLLESSKRKHEYLERAVLRGADALIVTSWNTKKEFLTKTDKPIKVITNGYDTHGQAQLPLDEQFSLYHIGSLLSERNPKILWETLSELIQTHPEFAKLFKLNLVGVVSEEILQQINEYGLKDHTNVLGYVSHEEALAYQMKAQLLLLIEIDSVETKAIIPGKVFEYMQSGRPIIAIGPEDSDIEHVLKETETGHYFNYHNKRELKNYLLECFKLYRQGKLYNHAKNLEKYSRKELTEELASLLNEYIH
jgi:glycosyltransferase involved in cell wall biosynthesis